MNISNIKIEIDNYVKDKTWYWYLPLWIFGLYLFIKILQFGPDTPQPFVIAIPQAFDFMLHEMAHIITGFLPAIITASAGSLSELLMGTLLVVGAIKGKSYFTILICSMWFMLCCQSVGIYMADARAQRLSLVSLGGELSGSTTVLHDWNFVFGQLHILQLDKFIGGGVRTLGILVGLGGLIFTAWLIYKMALADHDTPTVSS